MGKTRVNSALMLTFLLFGVLVLALVGGFGRQFFSRQSIEPPQDRFLRAVYVLQMMGGPATAETIAIPKRLKTSDATESLLHHPDRTFVLRSLAADLASLREEHGISEAALFEAYARVDLGETGKASSLLSAYVADHPYKAGQYALLCSLLQDLQEYRGLLLICAEWRGRDPECRADRLTYTWLALCRLGRFLEARDLMLRDGDCLEWRRFLYAARAAQAAGKRDEAGKLTDTAAQSPAYAPPSAEALRQELLSMDFEGK